MRVAKAAPVYFLVHTAATMDIEAYKALGLEQNYPSMQPVNDRSNMELIDALDTPEDARYQPCAESVENPEVPQGRIEHIHSWSDTSIYDGTYREIAIYVPTQIDSDTNLMIFNDGLRYADPEGPVRATRVLDKLIHDAVIKPTIGVFVMPGRLNVGPTPADPTEVNPADMDQRSFEYDSLTPIYGNFLINELLPFVEQKIGMRLPGEASQRAICGISSGGIAAFNAAWHHPDKFGVVVSHCGSFVNIRGGHNYPYLVRSTPRKDLRVFLTSGAGDANIIFGSWPLANQQMAAALEYAGYDFYFEFGQGCHSLRHGGSLFAETLRWMWSI